MSRRSIRIALVAALLVSGVVLSAPAAQADCAQDPDALTFHEMIDKGTTGKDRFPAMILGVGDGIVDRGGGPGGRSIARLAVVDHPVGFASPVARVRFWRDPPGMGTFPNFEFGPHGRYVVLARRLDDGSLKFDGACGQTRRLNRERFRGLVRYALNH